MNKNLYYLSLIAVCLLVLTSCSRKFNFVTKGLPNTDSSYLVTTSGKHIDASVIEVKTNNKLYVDGQEHSLDDLSAIRSKKMYFGVKDGQLYLGDIYGKICLLYKLSYGTSYQANMPLAGGGYTGNGMPGSYTSTVTKIEYLQKQGSTDIDKLNAGTLMDYVSDNDEALSLVRGSRTWHTVSYIPFAGFVGGAVWTTVKLLQYNKATANGGSANLNLGTPLIITAASIPVYMITGGIANHKLHKAIKIYNSTANSSAQ